jgi:hypothetical protein
MISWKKLAREVPNVDQKIKITLSERIGKIYERMKTSERKTMSESAMNERETFTQVTMDTDSLSREVSNK